METHGQRALCAMLLGLAIAFSGCQEGTPGPSADGTVAVDDTTVDGRLDTTVGDAIADTSSVARDAAAYADLWGTVTGSASPPFTCETPDEVPLIDPIWQAGGPGQPGELGKFGRPDAIFLTDDGLLLAGDEHADYEVIHLYDTTT
ncbi:MAG: hypothetical protein QF464_19665, partial [Myxococcota bacterium]|nr:hypothetical protein [Myxococcota bacterium]